MFQRLPKPLEIALIAVMALICAAVVLASPKKDSALFFASVPLFLVCAIMGFRRSERTAQPVEIEPKRDAIEENV
ncbi:MAG TPA: hypothetical protein VGI81_25305 [Tepidisphaeraceae bacterium]